MKQDNDWKIFREKIPLWQEAYMDKLNKEYVELLNGDGLASEKFWALEARIKQDKRSLGVRIEMRKSDLQIDIMTLLHDGVICLHDLNEFSDGLRETAAAFAARHGVTESNT